MSDYVIITVGRDPEKIVDGEEITPFGAQQTAAAVSELIEHLGPLDLIGYSGLMRTRQAAVVAMAMNRFRVGTLSLLDDFNPEGVIEKSGFNGEAVDSLIKQRVMVASALHSPNVGKYANMAREHLTNAILNLAGSMRQGGFKNALVLSHSPFSEMACTDPSRMPFGIREADNVIYKIKGGEIVDFTLLPAPFI